MKTFKVVPMFYEGADTEGELPLCLVQAPSKRRALEIAATARGGSVTTIGTWQDWKRVLHRSEAEGPNFYEAVPVKRGEFGDDPVGLDVAAIR